MKFFLTLLLSFASLVCFGQSTLVFYDDFEDNRWGWGEYDNDDAQGKFNYGRYEFKHKKESGSWSEKNSVAIDDKKPWMIETALGHLKGIDNNSYGLIFGSQGADYYQFTLSGNKYFIILYYCRPTNIS
jgi:hypothetical protein